MNSITEEMRYRQRLCEYAVKVKLIWSKVTDADGYIVYRATSKNGKYKETGNLTGGGTVSYTNSRLKTGKTYYYKVKAYRVIGGDMVYSAYSAVRAIKTRPAAVSRVKVKAGKHKAVISWKKSADVSGYAVYRAFKQSGKYIRIATIKKNRTVKFT
jgi:fibronectin type 3 domain-containing protein